MTKKSDEFEHKIALSANSTIDVVAIRPDVGPAYSDIRVTYNGKTAWVEAKMHHGANLANPRFFYASATWQSNSISPVSNRVVESLNYSEKSSRFICGLSAYINVPTDKLVIGPSAYTVCPQKVKAYFKQADHDRYILWEEDEDIGSLATKHYTEGKAEPAYYMQTGDDFYMISDKNPLGLPADIPLLEGYGTLKARVASRSKRTEIVAELKLPHMKSSKYSLLPGTSKLNPFTGK